jgi:hypothetical protein
MKPIRVNIETEPYATTKWYGATVTLETEEEINLSIAVAENDNLDSQILEITFTEGLPHGVNEEEIKKLVKDEFTKSDY